MIQMEQLMLNPTNNEEDQDLENTFGDQIITTIAIELAREVLKIGWVTVRTTTRTCYNKIITFLPHIDIYRIWLNIQTKLAPIRNWFIQMIFPRPRAKSSIDNLHSLDSNEIDKIRGDHNSADVIVHWQMSKGEKSRNTQHKTTAVCARLQSVPTMDSAYIDKEEFNRFEEEDEDLDSMSVTSGLTTPVSSTVISTDNTRICELEQKLALLQSQMELLLQQNNSLKTGQPAEIAKVPIIGKTSACIPPPPPLPPNFDLKSSKPLRPSDPANEKSRDENACLKTSGQTNKQETETKRQPALTEILKEINNVKLKKVQRSPGGTPHFRRRVNLEQNPTLAGVLARAMSDRRNKLDKSKEESTSDEEWTEGDEAEQENGIFPLKVS